MDLIRRNPYVSFEMDGNHELFLHDEKMSCTMGYESVIGQGEVTFIEENQKLDALKRIMEQYHVREFPFNPAPMVNTEVFCVHVETMTGKRRVIKRNG